MYLIIRFKVFPSFSISSLLTDRLTVKIHELNGLRSHLLSSLFVLFYFTYSLSFCEETNFLSHFVLCGKRVESLKTDYDLGNI